MGNSDDVQDLTLLSAELQAAPHDLGVWLRLANAVSGAGERERAAAVFSSLGTAANELGQVALAVACARWLHQAKRSDTAAELVSDIATIHSADSDRIDRSSRPRPPTPPKQSGKQPAARAAKDLAEAVDLAERAVAVASEEAKARAGAKVPPTPLVSSLGREDIEQLINVTKLVRRKQGQPVVTLGEKARALYWLARGAVRVTRNDTELGELRSGAFFGEIGLLAGTTRTATVTCTEESWLLEISKADVEAVADRAPRLAAVLAEHARARLLANVMRTSELFQRLTAQERSVLLVRFETNLFESGTSIVSEGADNESLHVIVSGRCAVRAQGEDVAQLTVGDGFGEASLLRRTEATADVVALEPTVTLSLKRQGFDDIAVQHPELLAEVYKLLIQREQANQALYHDASDLII